MFSFSFGFDRFTSGSNSFRQFIERIPSNFLKKEVARPILFFTLFIIALLHAGSAQAQASVVAGSVSNSKLNYSPGLGNNRVLVVSVSDENNNSIGSISSITWGGQSLTFAVGRNNGGSISNDLRGEIWYLNEAGISAASSQCNNFIVTWSTGPAAEIFTVLTVKDADQATPLNATGNGAPSGNSTTATLSSTAAGANDLLLYCTATQANTATHTAAAGYTEHSDQNISNTAMAVASKQIVTNGTEAPVATWTMSSQTLIVGIAINGVLATGPITYYSRNATSGGAWDSNTSWTTSSDGSGGPLAPGVWPRRQDNIVIRAGHTITVNATNDNKSCGRSPDGLLLSNVGSFISSNLAMFYQTGDITIRGSFVVTGVELMLGGYTHLVTGGTFSPTSFLVNTGYLEVDAGTTLTGFNSLVLTGNSVTIINTNSSFVDDLIIDHTDATLCGTGSAQLQNGLASVITYANAGTLSQVCSTFTVTCTGTGCSGFPTIGTGASSLGNSGPGGVASTDGTSELKVWLDAGKNVFSNAGTTPAADGGPVQQWSDRSGSANHATRATNRPLYDAADPAINNASAIDFTAASSNLLNLNTFTLNPATSSFSIISVLNDVASATNQNIIQQKDVSGAGRTLLLYDGPNSKLISFLGNVTTAPAATYTSATWTILSQTYTSSPSPTTIINLYNKGASDGSGTVTAESTSGPWLIGANKAESALFFNGSMSELLILNQSVNAAKRIIIENYLSAKYNIALTANNVYTMDDGAAVFDYEVAGIGQATDGSKHKDARGTGMVRMWNPNDLTNNEFLMWGHNNAAILSVATAIGTDVDGTIIQERLSRIWRAGEQGDVGTVSVSFDLSSLVVLIGSNIRLLIDRDHDGFQDNDVLPVAGSFINNTITFSGVNFQNGDYFTLGNTDKSNSLPIELLTFNAKVQNQSVLINWSTATELNNDFFTVERTSDGEKFEAVSIVKGQATSNSKRNYKSLDEHPLLGTSYYRLKQTDFDGRSTYSELKQVEFTNSGSNLKVYPNPVTDHKFDFELTGVDPDKEVLLSVLNSLGIPVFEATYLADQTGRIKATVDLNSIMQGVYIVRVNAGAGLRARIIIQ